MEQSLFAKIRINEVLIMLKDTLTRLKRAENLLNDSRRFADTEPYYLNRIRDISSDLELLIEEIETHV